MGAGLRLIRYMGLFIDEDRKEALKISPAQGSFPQLFACFPQDGQAALDDFVWLDYYLIRW
jgi:hypothetical protein